MVKGKKKETQWDKMKREQAHQPPETGALITRVVDEITNDPTVTRAREIYKERCAAATDAYDAARREAWDAYMAELTAKTLAYAAAQGDDDE